MKKIILLLTTFLVILLGIFGINNILQSQTNNITNEGAEDMNDLNYVSISPERFMEEIKSMNKEDYVILDVRTKEEYDEERIPNSILVTLDNIKEEVEDVIEDKNVRIYVYCRSGRRSLSAAYQLLEMGYTKVLDLGGIIDYPYEKVKGKN